MQGSTILGSPPGLMDMMRQPENGVGHAMLVGSPDSL
jgi:hypothetical protein